MNSKIIDSKNLSGIINYKINYSNDFLSLIKIHDKTNNIDLKNMKLLDKNIYQQEISSSKKLVLTNYSENLTSSGKNYDITLSFTEIEELTKKNAPFFIENSIFMEKEIVYCQSKFVFNSIGDSKKIKDQFLTLKEEEKKTIIPYLTIIKFKKIYILPSQIIIQSSTNGEFSSEVLDSYTSTVFESDILNKLKKDDKEIMLSFYKKNKNIYNINQGLNSEDKQQITDILNSVGFKNKVIFEFSLIDILTSQKNIEFTVAYKR